MTDREKQSLKIRLGKRLSTDRPEVMEIVKEEINNTPTIAVNCKDCDGYEAGYSAGLKDAKRPQGEWIIVKDEKWGDNVKCPFCEKELAGTDLNFCCKCGAKLIGSEKMNGGAE